MKLKAPVGLATLAFAVLLLVSNATFGQTTAARSGAGPIAAPGAATGRPTVEQVLAEINLARSNPAAYAEYLTAMRPMFKGNLYSHPGQPTIATNEGVAALDEAIAFLRAQPSAPLGGALVPTRSGLVARRGPGLGHRRTTPARHPRNCRAVSDATTTLGSALSRQPAASGALRE